MKKEVAGQPVWLWAVGAGVVILGYLYFRSHASSSTSGSGGSGTGQGGTGKDTSQSSFKEWITQHDASSATHHRRPIPPVPGGGKAK